MEQCVDYMELRRWYVTFGLIYFFGFSPLSAFKIKIKTLRFRYRSYSHPQVNEYRKRTLGWSQ